MTQIVHKLIAKNAKALASEAYEKLAHFDDFYRANPNVTYYVNKRWRHFIGLARQMLTGLLTLPTTPGFVKEEIYEALLIDGSFKAPPSKGADRIGHFIH